MRYDYLIVGAGLSGAVLAERLSSIGKSVLVIDRRDHIGGNCHDMYDDRGVLIHRYGPHYFRTNDRRVKEYLSSFTDWIPGRARIRTSIDGKLFPFPINRTTMNMFFGTDLETEEETRRFLASKRENLTDPKNAQEKLLSMIGQELMDAFYSGYTRKQWGLSLKDLEPSVVTRIPVRMDTKEWYFDDDFQALPVDGYHRLFQRMLGGIDVRLEMDLDDLSKRIQYDRLIHTGAIDEFFDFKFGRLPYRSLRFEFESFDQDFYQDWVQINYPSDGDHTRIVEIKHLTGQKVKGTTIVREYPEDDGDRYYPVPTRKNRELYERYREEAEGLEDVFFTGRLGLYEYLNMDQVIGKVLDLFEELKAL